MAADKLFNHSSLERYNDGVRAGLDDIITRLDQAGRFYDYLFLKRVCDYARRLCADQSLSDGLGAALHVGLLVADQNLDETCVAAGILQSALKEANDKEYSILEEFGDDTYRLVDGVSRLARLRYLKGTQEQAEVFRRLVLKTSSDEPRVLLIRIAERLHAISGAGSIWLSERRRLAFECLDVYAPLCEHLGIQRIRRDLQDLSFFRLYPLQFAELESMVQENLRVSNEFIQGIRERLEEQLKRKGIEAEISYRVKHYYSIYQKLRRQGIDISQLYDYLTFRIVTRELRDTYAVLGALHESWRPIPGRFKDYIAMPKPNLYQSLHTTLVDGDGHPFEVQIRTWAMDLVAEEGYVARSPRDLETGSFQQMLERQKELKDSRDAPLLARLEGLYGDKVFVFSPDGEIFSFPFGATPLDFAYRIHTELGNRYSGALINGSPVAPQAKLQDGDRVEILTDIHRLPSRDWLEVAVTSRAKRQIRRSLNDARRGQTHTTPSTGHEGAL